MNDPLAVVDSCVPNLGSRHDDVRAEARLQLGVHYAAQGEPELALRELAGVDSRDNRVAAARACLRLHRLLIAAGEDTEAWDALARASELSDPRHSPDVELELAARAAALGQRVEAARRYRGVLAAFTHTHRLGALAAFRFGELVCEQGARDQAAALWRLALQGADENLRPHVLTRLADSLRDRPGDSEAPGLYKLVVETDHPYLAPRAALALAGLLERRDQVTAALEMYATAISSGDSEVAEVADLRRRVLMGDRARAVVRHLHGTADGAPNSRAAMSAFASKPQGSSSSRPACGCGPPATQPDTLRLSDLLEDLARAAGETHDSVVLALRAISVQAADWCGLSSAALIDFGAADQDTVNYVLCNASRFFPAEASNVWFYAPSPGIDALPTHIASEAELPITAVASHEQGLIFPLYYAPKTVVPAELGRTAADESSGANSGTCTCHLGGICDAQVGRDPRSVCAEIFFAGHSDLCIRRSRFPPA
jgi:tetratricopeptide (TPR) repeat protein